MVTSDEEITRLHRLRKTVMELLRDRGYMVSDFEVDMSRHQFIQKYGEDMKREDLFINKALRSNNSDQIYVFFPEEPEVNVRALKTCTVRMKEENVHRAILVVQKKVNRFARSCISEISPEFHFEVFKEAELLVDIKGILIPEIHLITSKEKKSLLERYNVKVTQLPRIQVTDLVARYYGMKHGQVLKITRPSATVDCYVTYRYVV